MARHHLGSDLGVLKSFVDKHLSPSPRQVAVYFVSFKYGVRCTEGTRELMWFKENELVRKASTTVDWF